MRIKIYIICYELKLRGFSHTLKEICPAVISGEFCPGILSKGNFVRLPIIQDVDFISNNLAYERYKMQYNVIRVMSIP